MTANAPTVILPASEAGATGAQGLSTNPRAAISVRGLRKAYGAFQAVAGVDFDILPGEIVAFLGPNGAGKTTTVEILEGYRERTAGEVRVLGEDPRRAPMLWRDRIGVVLQESEAEPDLTVRECLELYAGYHLHPRSVSETIELVGLTGKAGSRGRQLSGGQRRRLDVALALIGDPELVFMDEPTTGFDPSARRQAWEVIAGLRSLGKTIFLTTHYMDEAERLADRIIVIAKGRIVAEGPPATLGGRDTRPTMVSLQPGEPVARDSLPEPIRSKATLGDDGAILFTTHEPLHDLAVLNTWADRNGGARRVEVHQPTLEDIYLELTGEAG